MGIFPRVKTGRREKNAKDHSLGHKESLLQEKKIKIKFLPLSLQKQMKNKTIILHLSACSIRLCRVIPGVQRHFIRQVTFQKTARKSRDTKGSRWGNFHWVHSLHPEGTEAVKVLRTFQSCRYLQELIPLALQTPEQATIKPMTL